MYLLVLFLTCRLLCVKPWGQKGWTARSQHPKAVVSRLARNPAARLDTDTVPQIVYRDDSRAILARWKAVLDCRARAESARGLVSKVVVLSFFFGTPVPALMSHKVKRKA